MKINGESNNYNENSNYSSNSSSENNKYTYIETQQAKENLFGGIQHETYGEIPVQKCNMEYMTMLRLSGICIALSIFCCGPIASIAGLIISGVVCSKKTGESAIAIKHLIIHIIILFMWLVAILIEILI